MGVIVCEEDVLWGSSASSIEQSLLSVSSFKLTVGEKSPITDRLTVGLTVVVLFRLPVADDYSLIVLVFH